MTTAQKRVIRRRYPLEGASDSLCFDLGLQAWQVRNCAKRLGIRVDAALKQRKQRQYTRGKTWEKR